MKINTQQHSAAIAVMDAYAYEYAKNLLETLGITKLSLPKPRERQQTLVPATSGLLSLAKDANGTQYLCPVPLTACAEGALIALRSLLTEDTLQHLCGADLLTERAKLAGHRSIGQSCRLLKTKDGQIAINLPRDADWENLPALLMIDKSPDWYELANMTVHYKTDALLARARVLGLAVADTKPYFEKDACWFYSTQIGKPFRTDKRAPRVLDLSSLWAGPLCSRIWQLAGAEVTKVESTHRPDGARFGDPVFFSKMNDAKRTVFLNLPSPDAVASLREMILDADIVIEGSRPRALRQMGIIAEELVTQSPGLTWLSITGHGREDPESQWIGYGDDAAVAGGLSYVLHQVTGKWLICGDAIADPLTGLHAALAGWHSWLTGGGRILTLSLSETVRHCIEATRPHDNNYLSRYKHWVNKLSAVRVTTNTSIKLSKDKS